MPHYVSNKDTVQSDKDETIHVMNVNGDTEAGVISDRNLSLEPYTVVDGGIRGEAAKLIQPVFIGVFAGISVAVFKLTVEALRELCYGSYNLDTSFLWVVPAFGGLAVGILSLFGAFPPGLRDTVQELDKEASDTPLPAGKILKNQINFFRKSSAAVFTLGTGCSLGPEGPSVELGMNLARLVMEVTPSSNATTTTTAGSFPTDRVDRNRLLLSCGAAAGVAAGFNAPLAGVFFVLEIMQGAFSAIDKKQMEKGELQVPHILMSTTGSISAILLSSVLAALASGTVLGNHLVLTLADLSLETPLVELPLYLLLGAASGIVAFSFTQTANFSQKVFNGKVGPPVLRRTMIRLPQISKPLLGGLVCGVVGMAYPQILFFGYETLNSLITKTTIPTDMLVSLLFVKLFTTAISAGSGLVGGTFAPSLFLGAMLGASFHNGLEYIFQTYAVGANMEVLSGLPIPNLALAELNVYTMVGAGSVLAALFRAPLTASLLMFELTRDYDVILPLLASAGLGSLVGDLLEGKVKLMKEEQKRRRDQDAVSWGDLSDKFDDPKYGGRGTLVEEEEEVVQQAR